MHDMVEEFVPGDLVLVKNRASGVFEPNLLGPFEVVRYKDAGKYVLELMDNDGSTWECAVSHVVPLQIEDGVDKYSRW